MNFSLGQSFVINKIMAFYNFMEDAESIREKCPDTELFLVVGLNIDQKEVWIWTLVTK